MTFTSKLFSNFYKYKRKINKTVILKNLVRNYSATLEQLKVVFFGTDNFSLPSLEALYNESKVINSKISSIDVVTSFKAQSNPVRNFAVDKGLQLFKWPIEPDCLRGNHIGIVVSFGHLIPNRIISSFPLGMINVHASLLPRWRGAAPIIYAIMNDDKTTGISIMKVRPHHFDIGEILAQKEISLKPDVLLPEVHDKLANEGAHLLLKVVNGAPKSLENARQQEKNLVTYAPKVTAAIAHIRWKEMSARQIYNLYRALYSFHQLKTAWQGHIINIVELNLNNSQSKDDRKDILPGFIEYSKQNKSLKVLCSDRFHVNILKVKVEGKKVMSAMDFNNGYLNKCPRDQRYFKLIKES